MAQSASTVSPESPKLFMTPRSGRRLSTLKLRGSITSEANSADNSPSEKPAIASGRTPKALSRSQLARLIMDMPMADRSDHARSNSIFCNALRSSSGGGNKW